jgi:hypothetical protein
VRLRFSTEEPPTVTSLEVFGRSRWNTREVVVELGCEGRPSADVSVEAYNGRIRSITRAGSWLHMQVSYT